MILRSSVEQLYNAIILSNLFLSYTFIRSCLMIRTRALTIVWLWIHEKKQEFQSQYFSILAREGTQFFMGHYQSLFLQIVHQSSGILPCLSFWGPSLDETTLPAELWLSTSNCKYLTTVTSNCNTLHKPDPTNKSSNLCQHVWRVIMQGKKFYLVKVMLHCFPLDLWRMCQINDRLFPWWHHHITNAGQAL